MDKKIWREPEEHMKWVYDPHNPEYRSEHANDLRIKRWLALNSLSQWMICDANNRDGWKRGFNDGK